MEEVKGRPISRAECIFCRRLNRGWERGGVVERSVGSFRRSVRSVLVVGGVDGVTLFVDGRGIGPSFVRADDGSHALLQLFFFDVSWVPTVRLGAYDTLPPPPLGILVVVVVAEDSSPATVSSSSCLRSAYLFSVDSILVGLCKYRFHCARFKI